MNKSAVKYTFHPKRYRLGEMEKYYSDMAAKGFHLVKRGICFSKFTKGEPSDMKYRVEVVYRPKTFDADKMPVEQLAVYEDCGWEFVNNDSFVHIFRAPAYSDTEEFYIDPSQQAETLKGMKSNLFLSSMQIPATIFFFIILNIVVGENISDQVYLAWITHTYEMLGLLALIILTMADSLMGTIHLSKLYRRMKKGVPLDHSPKGYSFMGIPITGFAWCLIILLNFIVFTKNTPLQPLDAGGPYITLQELGLSDKIASNKDSGYKLSVSPYGQYWDCRESMGSEWIFRDVYLLKDRNKCEKTAYALMENSTFAREAKVFNEITVDGLDRAWYSGSLERVAIKDNKVAIFTTIMDSEAEVINLLSAIAQKWDNY